MRSVPAFPHDLRTAVPACPFVGREQELQQLVQHAAHPRMEGPGVAVVTGAAGTGKTTLLHRLGTQLPGHLVIGTAGRATRPFWLAEQLIARLHEHGLAVNVLPGGPHRQPHTMGQRLLTAFAAAGAGRILTVVVDDVQHADPESSLALGYATRRLYGQHIQFVLSVRAPDDSGTDPNVARILPARGTVLHTRLGGLGTHEIQALGHAMGLVPMRLRDARLIRAYCDGNPRQVTRLLEELRRDPHVRSGHQPLTLRSFTTTCAEQLAELPAPSRRLMWALAVLDERCPLSTVAGVAEVERPLHALEPLLTAGLVQWWSAEPTTPLRIMTPPLRQAAYDSIPAELRRTLHRRTAAVVPADRALPHRMRAAAGTPDPELADDLAAAGWRWIAEGNLARAAQYLLWAADVSGPGRDQDLRLLFGISLLQRGGQYEAAARLRDRALRCAASPLRSCVIGRYAMVDGDLTGARLLFDGALAELERAPWTPDYRRVAAIAYTWLALLHGWLGDPVRARAAASHCLSLSPYGRRLDRGTELVYLSTSCELDGPTAAYRQLAAIADLPAAPTEVDPSDALLLMQRGHLRVLLGEPADGVADIEAGLDTGRAAGMNDIDDWAHFWAAGGHIALDQWERAQEHAAAALEIVQTDGRPHASTMLALLSYIEANTGQLTVAMEHANAATELADNLSLPSDRVLPALALAAVARAGGDHLGVVEALRPFTGDPAPSAMYRWLWLPAYLEALLELGRVDEAQVRMATVECDITRGYRVLVVPARYLAARAAEVAGDPGCVLAYESVLRAPATLGGRGWRAAAGAARRRLLDSTAGHIAEQGAAGGPSRLTGLTERERAIADLIAAGLTNRAVSDRLGITQKTIEAHLTRVYRKLDVKSRGELRARLDGRRFRRTVTPHARSGSM
jgi:DNA-binding CsgD family transcriptional regulator/tetratricopeptide (TPR) repeat protein